MRNFHIVLCVILLCGSLFAKSDKFSPIALPHGNFLNIDYEACDNNCLKKLLDKDQVFSFMSKYKDENATKYLQEQYLIYGHLFNVFLAGVDTKNAKIAVLVPQKTIRNYALTSVNAITAYLLRQSNEFELGVFNSGDESKEALLRTLGEIKKEGFSYVIALVTQDGADTLLGNIDGLYVFIPTLHRSIIENVPTNAAFGGIDYNAQIEALNSFSSPLAVIFSDESKLGLSLNQMVKDQDKTVRATITLSSAKDNLKQHFDKNRDINRSSVYLNTMPITTSLLTSQLRLYKYTPYSLLSTQINYQPVLLEMTQYEARKDLYLASSIGEIDDELDGINSILGNNLEYDWVNYAASIGTEYLLERFFNDKLETIFNEEIINGQTKYDTKIYRAGRYSFSLQTKQLDPNRKSDISSPNGRVETYDDEEDLID